MVKFYGRFINPGPLNSLYYEMFFEGVNVFGYHQTPGNSMSIEQYMSTNYGQLMYPGELGFAKTGRYPGDSTGWRYVYYTNSDNSTESLPLYNLNSLPPSTNGAVAAR